MATSLRVIFALAALAVFAEAARIRVGLYTGNGTSSVSAGNYTTALNKLVASGAVTSFKTLSPDDVAVLSLANFDAVIFPGGTGSGEAAAIGSAGSAALTAFVAAGGGYIGTCAGGYLAGNESCCSVSIPGYCEDRVGCYQSSYALGFVDMGVAEPWDRGMGDVTVQFSAEGLAALKLDPVKYGGNVTFRYAQGPVQSRDYTGQFTALASFTSEIHSRHTAITEGQQVGTPAIITTQYHGGRVLVSSPHPEETTPMLLDVIEAYILWVTRNI